MQLIKDNIDTIAQTLVDAAIKDEDLTSARALLNHYTQARQQYVDAPDLAKVPVEHRHEQIFQHVASARISIDHAERLATTVSHHIRTANTVQFLRFLREVAEGADPATVARRLAAELEAPEAAEAH